MLKLIEKASREALMALGLICIFVYPVLYINFQFYDDKMHCQVFMYKIVNKFYMDENIVLYGRILGSLNIGLRDGLEHEFA